MSAAPEDADPRQRARRWRALPYRWALRDAEVISANERLVLSAYADHADPDGTGAYPGPGTLMRITMLDESTIRRTRNALVARGLMAAGDQSRARRLPSGQRPKVVDLMVPFSWYEGQKDGAEALRDINAARKAQGMAPLTRDSRPDLKPAPARKARADKGKPKPKKAAAEPGGSDASQGEGQASSLPFKGSEEPKTGLEACPRGGLKPAQDQASSQPTAPIHLASDLADDVVVTAVGQPPVVGAVDGGGSAASDKIEPAEKAAPRDLRAVLAGIPAPLVPLLAQQFPGTLPSEVADWVAHGLLREERTVGELVERMGRRWVAFGYETAALSADGEGIRSPRGVLGELLSASKCWGNNDRCEDGTDLDTGAECPRCVEARTEKAAAERPKAQPSAERPDPGPETPEPPAGGPQRAPESGQPLAGPILTREEAAAKVRAALRTGKADRHRRLNRL